MPNRIIKESIRTSDTVDELNWFEECLFYRLIVSVDDYGRYDGRPAIVKNTLFPLKENLTTKAVAEAIMKLASVGLVERYEVFGKPYLRLLTWTDHQQVRAVKSKYPAPEDGNVLQAETTCNHMISDDIKCNQMKSDVAVIVNDNRNRNRNTNTVSAKPTLDEVQAYAKERNSNADPEQFYDYYTANGWTQGKGKPIKDWQACFRNWERNDFCSSKPKSRNKIAECKPTNAANPDDLKKLLDMI